MAAEIKIALSTPVKLGENGELIESLTLKPTARAFRDFALQMRDDGTVVFEPYKLAGIGVRLAGQVPQILDLLDPADMMEVATAVMGFLGTRPRTGKPQLQ